jgi:hypothetical protein
VTPRFVLDTRQDQSLSRECTYGKGSGLETLYPKWHVTYTQGTRVFVVVSTQSRNLLHILLAFDLLSTLIFPSSVGDTHQVGGFQFVVETCQARISKWVLVLFLAITTSMNLVVMEG